ncbi:MAG: box helicase domain protein [Frankiales bacterium]|nr:box helicase domain protein [Frankiales bacterium]
MTLQPVAGGPDAVLDAFTAWAPVTLYPAQEEALLELLAGNHVVLATPTGSGKSLVALGAHLAAWSEGRQSVYTAPIKALVSEKFFALCDVFGAENVGMATGDAAVNTDAPIVCCTAEVLANRALRHGTETGVGLVVMDEFHYYGDVERGWAWQVPLLEMTTTQFLLMSATLGDTSSIREDLTRRTGRETAEVAHAERPIPLSFEWSLEPLHEKLQELLETKQAPVYVVHATQESAVERAQALMSVNVCTREEKDRIASLIGGFRFTTKFGTTLSRLVRHGIGVHHAGMLPKYRRLVETLAQAGLLKVVCGTDTLGVGINVPIRTVMFTTLAKYDGTRTRHLRAREFHQIAGRAGRAGFDTAGLVVVQAPDHVIENTRALAKFGDDEKKKRSYKRKSPPDGFVSWDEKTFERLVNAQPETLTSHFKVTAAMLLNVAARGQLFTDMWRLLNDNHEPRKRQLQLIREAIRLYRSLEAGGVMQRTPGQEPTLTVDLPENFALDQPLALFALAALDVLDPELPTYSLDVISVVESTLDDPRQVLNAQRKKARGDAVAEMKADGIEYEERMTLLEDVTYPRPLDELLVAAYDIYRQTHPWVLDHELKPKAVARDLWEQAMTFNEYVSFYGLQRSEGLVLRSLADAYKTLRRSVPPTALTPELEDFVTWLGELVRQVDSSLLDEWTALTSGTAVPEEPVAVTRSDRAFRVLVRNAMWRRVHAVAYDRADLLRAMDPDVDWAAALDGYFGDHEEVLLTADARGPAYFRLDGDTVTQVLVDESGDHDWALTGTVDRAASDEAGEAVVLVTALAPLGPGWMEG